MNIEQIIQGCIDKSPQMQAALVRRFAPMFKAISLRYVPDHRTADDVVQEAFINVFKYIKNFKGTGSFEGWMRRIVVNAALNYRKKHVRFSYDITEIHQDDEPQYVPDVYEKLDKYALLSIIKQLPEKYYIVFTLFVIDGFNHQEISEKLDISVGTSRSLLSRARTKLIEIMKKENFDYSYPQLKVV